jgi:cytochrome c554/c'-like protein
MRKARWRWAAGLAGTLGSLAFLSCTDVEYVDLPEYEQPPAGAANFLGYRDRLQNETVCGNCHVTHQAIWEETAHADAFTTLEQSGHMQTACQGCHTVNQRGNASPDTEGGWIGTQDPRYHDVQCENCHGPGLTHVENPETTQPLASLAVGADLTVGCGECHTGVHHPFVEEWEQSAHAGVIASPAGRAECQGCHTGQAALRAWGITSDYIEKNSATHLPIVCGVCHDPHSNRASRRLPPTQDVDDPIRTPESGGQLRFSVDVPNEEENLCMKCHHKRAQPDIDPVTLTSRGPHSPEGPLLLGENVGFWFGDTIADNDRIVGTHGTGRNPKLCAGCHMPRFTATDPATGTFQFQVTGHLFLPIPCLNNGIPTADTTCVITARTFRSCTASGCHGSEDAARSAFITTRNDVLDRAAELKRLVDQVRATEISGSDKKWTIAEGADFNYQLAVKRGSFVHNPFLIRELLRASINEMKEEYGIQ